MPQVPIVGSPSVLPDRANPVYQRFETGDWGVVGRALSNFGGDVTQFGQVIAANSLKLSNERATADANNAYLSASVESGQVGADYFSKEGSNATDAYPDYLKSLQEIRDKHLAQLGSDKAKQLFDNDFTRTIVNDSNAGARHAATQHKIYVSGQSDARVQQAINDSAAKFGDNGAFEENQGVIGREMKNKAATEGWSQERLDFETSKAQGVAYAARIREMAIYDPFTAEKLFNDNRGKLDPDAVPVIENAIRVSKQTVGVKKLVGQVFGAGDVGRPVLVAGMQSLERFKTDPTADLKDVSAALQDGMARGAMHLPPGVTLHVTEGYTTSGHAPHSQHKVLGRGAVDYTLFKNGVPIPNSGPDTTGLYGLFARATAMELRKNHPQEANNFRYGGTFETSKGSGRADIGHMDLGGSGGARIGAGTIQGGAQGFLGRIISTESGGRGGQISSAGAVGLMQILPATAQQAIREMNAEGNHIPYSYEHLLHDDSYNMMIGKHILNKLLNKYGGNEMLAAAAYNAGEGRVDSLLKGGVPNTAEEVQAFISRLPAETQNYVHKVAGATGVGYDPAPGREYYTQNSNLGAGPQGLPWSVREAQIAAAAEQMAPGDDNFLQSALSAGRTRYNIENDAKTEEQQSAYDLVVSSAISNKYTSEEQLLTNEATKSAYYKLDAQQRISTRNLLESLSKQDIPETTPMQERFFRYREILNNGTEEQKKALPDPYGKPPAGEPDFSNAQKKALSEIRTAKQPATPASAADKLAVDSKFNLLSEALKAAGLIVPARDQTEQTANNLAAFKGQFAYELNQLAQSHPNKPVSDQEAIQLGNDLMQKVTYLQPDPLWPGVLPYVKREVPLFVMSKKDLANYLEISPEAAEIVMKQEVPDSARQAIIDSITKRTGRPPTSEEVIWKIYQHGMFEMQRNSQQEPVQ